MCFASILSLCSRHWHSFQPRALKEISMSHPCIERNNLAISHMERRDFLSAITLMSESMWILKQDGSDRDLLPLVPSIPQEEVDSQLSDSARQLEDASDEEISRHAPPDSPRKDHHHPQHRQDVALDDAISIFRCPLRIHTETNIDDDTYAEICSILTYNCALAYHLNGMELTDAEGRILSLKHALSLYQKAHAIHLKVEHVEDSDVSFSLAILNNVGQLHGLMGNTMASTRCFHRMLRILMVVVSRTETCTAETDLFFGNCSRFVLDKPAAPAA